MKDLISWVAQNPTLQALAIVVTLTTAAYYLFKIVIAAARFIRDTITKGLKAAQENRANRIRMKHIEFQDSAQDTTIFIAYLAEKSALAALFVVMGIISNISLGVGEAFSYPQAITKILAVAIAAYRLGLVTGFVKGVREIRKNMLWPEGGPRK